MAVCPSKETNIVLEKAQDVRTGTDESLGNSTSECRQEDSGWFLSQNR